MRVVDQYSQEISHRTALVRCNFDVPINEGNVVDTTRIEDSLPTINYLRQHLCPVILIAHQGRPDGTYDPASSLAPIADTLGQLLHVPIAFVPYSDMFQAPLPQSDIILLDNLRFFPGEETKDHDFARKLASLAQFYVNESFATAHRDHTSITLLPRYLTGYLGISFAKEVQVLDRVLHQPQSPFVVVLGGAKLETKEPLIQVFQPHADQILVGGKIALDLHQRHQTLPDNVILAELNSNGKDITPASADRFAQIIKSAATVVWNGTMGVFEEPPNEQGTRIVAEAVNQTPAFTLVGGGDTETALTLLGIEHHISHISSGGGAMLTYLSEKSLVGLAALDRTQSPDISEVS